MISKGIAFQIGDGGATVNALMAWCALNQFPRRFFHKAKDVPGDWLPYGNVPWTEACLGRSLVPDYLPEWLSGWVFRKTWVQDEWPLGKRVHVKPAERYKRFTGFVTNGGYKGKKRGPLLCSEAVIFQDEWRYYVANGQVLAAHWYFAQNVTEGYVEPKAPELNIVWPEGFCGAVDFGSRLDDRIELLESHHAISAGWYGPYEDTGVFVEWLDAGWQSLKAKSPGL